MKDRQKRMLRLLLNTNDIVHLEELAEVFSIGKRTVSRDMDTIEHWLSLKGAQLERVPGKGIQVKTFGRTTGELLDIINKPSSYIDSLTPHVRQKLILLYILYNNREIKISDIANSFFISDTSVWNDLNLIENQFKRSTLELVRHKGVGIQITGEEAQIRLEFLETLTNLISSKTVIPYLYKLEPETLLSIEMNQFQFFLDKLNFPNNQGIVLESLRKLSERLGYQFTISGESLLYFYLQLTVHRTKSGALIQQEFNCTPYFEKHSKTLLDEIVTRVFSGEFPKGEISFLALIISVQEIGSLTGGPLPKFSLNPQIHSFCEKLISKAGEIDNRLYYLNERTAAIFEMTLTSLIHRYQHEIPLWHGDWKGSKDMIIKETEKKDLLSELLVSEFGVKTSDEDLDYILMYFHALFVENNAPPKKKIRCLVCCFEGIGLASYLQTILKREIDSIEIVEATAVFKVRQEYLDEKEIELVISTFPITGLSSPIISISLPLNKPKLVRDITIAAENLKSNYKKDKIPNIIPVASDANFSFQNILEFIGGFLLLKLEFKDNIELIIKQLSHTIAESNKASKELAISFQEREELGALYFEEHGVRVLHCKSSAITIPKAGVIDFKDSNEERMIFMIAPDPCPEETRKMLSAITISFMDNRSFRDAFMSGVLTEIRRSLMDVYRNMI